MTIDDELLCELWARASTLEERLSGAFEPRPGAEDEAVLRFEAWRGLVGEGDPERFRRRLEFDGWDLDRVAAILGDVAVAPGYSPPQEFERLAEILHAASEHERLPEELRRDVPFADVYAPMLAVGRRRLREQLGASAVELFAAVGAAALHGCERGLVERLAGVCTRTLYVEFEADRDTNGELGCHARLLARASGASLVDFSLEYAALARALAQITAQWVRSTAELLERLAADRRALIDAFGPAADSPISSLEVSLGDAHNDGRTVARVRFASDLELYYKPRDLGLDRAFAGLLEVCRTHGAPVDLRVPRCLTRAGYGWVEGVVGSPAADAADVEEFFERGGALVCMAYLLDITDCHNGNLIAAGAHPVLIDLETVCHQRARDLDSRYSDAERNVRNLLAESVLGSGLLPAARLEGDVRVELGGLSPGDEHDPRIGEVRWTALGTDAMRREIYSSTGSRETNLLRFAGRVVSIRSHESALSRGFERTYRFLADNRELLLAPDGPLEQLRHCVARFVFRGTMVYGALLDRVNAPELARAGIDRSLLFDVLARAYLDLDTRPASWPILAAERAALQQLDIPVFTTALADATVRVVGGPAISGLLAGDSLTRVRMRLAGLAERDLAEQLRFIRASLLRPLQAEPTPDEHDDDMPRDRESLRATAIDLAAQLWAQAVHGRDGSVSWVDTRVDAALDEYVQRPIPLCLGDGVAGIMLFAAALERGGAPAFVTELRRAARCQLELGVEQIAKRPLGGLTGASSIAYALAKTAELSGDREALALAQTVVVCIPLAAIAVDTELDVAGGVAGTLLCLAAVRDVAERAGDAALAQACSVRARACAARLEAVAQLNDGVIPTAGGRALTGLSHGHAGIALALACLRTADGGESLRPLLDSALAFERRHFDAQLGNWLDLRSSAASRCSCSWCHGAPGIGIARARLLELLAEDAQTVAELGRAATTTAAESLGTLDHLCCGNLGRVEALLIMARVLADPELGRRAEVLASRVVARANRRGGFHTLVGAPAAQQSLGLFTGLAGIGYALVRVADPSIPSPLAFT